MTPLHNATLVEYAFDQGFAARVRNFEPFKNIQAGDIRHIGTFFSSCYLKTATNVLRTDIQNLIA